MDYFSRFDVSFLNVQHHREGIELSSKVLPHLTHALNLLRIMQIPNDQSMASHYNS